MRHHTIPLALLLAVFLTGSAFAVNLAWNAQGGPPVAISADGSIVLSDGGVFTLYGTEGAQLWKGYGGSYVSSRGDIFSPLAITADGKYAVLGTGQGILYVDRNQRVFWQDTSLHPINDLSLSPDENFIASVAQGIVSVYTRGGEVVWRNGTYPDVQFVSVSTNGLLTVAGSGGVIHAFNQSGFELWNYSTTGIHGIKLSPADLDIIAASDYTLVCLHPSGDLLWKFYTGSEIRDFAVSRDSSTVAAGNQDGRLFVLDRDGNQLFSYQAGNWVNAVSVSGDGSLVAMGGIDRTVYLFDRSGQVLFSGLTGSAVRSVALSTDNSTLVVGSDMVYYYDLKQPSPPKSAPGSSPSATPISPRATATTPPPAPAVITTEVPPATAAVPGETPTPKSGSAPLAVLAVWIGAAWAMRRR